MGTSIAEFGRIFNIQRWSLHDGSGIRTTVFLQGCPLRCKWCSNPESWVAAPQLFNIQARCTSCFRCTSVCPTGASRKHNGGILLDRKLCQACGACTKVCPTGARELAGKEMAATEVLAMLRRDTPFYQSSGGGVTFSGGEPFLQSAFLRHLVQGCLRLGISCGVESSGYFPFAEVSDIFHCIDEIFIDLKHTDEAIHRQVTGVSNRIIMDNIKKIDQAGHKVTIRIPLVSGINDTSANIDAVGKFVLSLENYKCLELLPYHNYGRSKYDQLDLPYDDEMKTPELSVIEAILDRLHDQGITASCAADGRVTAENKNLLTAMEEDNGGVL